MQREIVTIPASLFRELKMTWDIDWRGQPGGQSNTGISQTVYNAFPRWVGQPEVFLNGSAITQWRAIRAQAQGRVGVYRVPMCDPLGFSMADTGQSFPTGIPFSNGQPFSTGFGFAYEPFAVAASAASAGATQIRVDVSAVGVAPKTGQIMSHSEWPFMVTWVTEVSTDVYDIGIQMPLRAAIAVDDPVLMQGVGLFEAIDEGMGNPVYGATQFSTVRLSFREVLNR